MYLLHLGRLVRIIQPTHVEPAPQFVEHAGIDVLSLATEQDERVVKRAPDGKRITIEHRVISETIETILQLERIKPDAGAHIAIPLHRYGQCPGFSLDLTAIATGLSEILQPSSLTASTYQHVRPAGALGLRKECVMVDLALLEDD